MMGRTDRTATFKAMSLLRAIPGLFLIGTFGSLLLTDAHGAERRPNIVLLLSDDQRADAVGFSGNPVVRTPQIDSLAESGFRFTNCFCMGSHHGAVCAPSRAMLMSGLYLHRVYDRLLHIRTLPQTLSENGYVTFGTGKWHNEREAFSHGFQRGRNLFFGGMSDHWRVSVVDMLDNGNFSPERTVGFSTEVFTNTAIQFLEEYAAGDRSQPFFCYVSLTVPHDPRTPPDAHRQQYRAADMPLPVNFLPVHPFNNGWMTGRDEQLAPWPRTERDIRSSLAEYYGLITHLDAQIGRILEALKRCRLYEETIIIFTSDHGLALGSHGLLGKQNLYEHSMKAPFVLAGPGIPKGRVSDALVYLMDLFPTLLGILDIQIDSELDGKSLLPLIRGTKETVRDTLFTAYEDTQRAIRDHRWKLIRYPRINHTQLFDLKTDPHETLNLAESGAHQKKVRELMGLLAKWQAKAGDPAPLTVSDPESMDFDWRKVQRRPDRHQPNSILRRYFPNGVREP